VTAGRSRHRNHPPGGTTRSGHRLVPGHLWVIIRPSGRSCGLHDGSVIRGSSGGHLAAQG
jgi:hypothetical protein